MSFSARFRTFGCKLNQIETESLEAAFAKAGFDVVARGAASAYVVNTCTVTSMAEQKARREIRQFLRESPEGVVVVTGCYASVSEADVTALGPRVVVVPGGFKSAVHALAHDLAEALSKGLDPFDAARAFVDAARGRPVDPFAFAPERFSFHSRASLKVEDGCDNRCAYCRVCIARGNAVSLDPDTAVARARELEATGAREIVLTGVNLSQYRHGKLGFAGLVAKLAEGTERVRFRISSWEPDKADDEFLAAFAHPRVCAHVHLSAQSGSDSVLARMGRRYDSALLADAIAKIRQVKGDPFIGFDAIAGFPGETDAEAAESAAFFKEAEPAWIHAFVFSPRPGTRADSMKPRVPERIATERARALAEIGRAGRMTYARRWIGKTLDAIVEGAGEADEDDAPPAGADPIGSDTSRPGCRLALSDNYLRLAIPDRKPDGSTPKPGTLERFRALDAAGDGSGRPGTPDLSACFT